MEASHLENNLYWYLLRIAIGSKHVLMQISEHYDLTVMQFYTLCMLDLDKSVPMSSLSEYLYCDPSNITGIVDRLFTRELIRREENPKDRRVKMITITPKGVDVCERIFAEIKGHESTGLAGLSASQRKQLTGLLGRVLDRG